MIQAVLFDLDGTLTNTIDDIATAMNRALRLHGLPGWSPGVGLSRRMTWRLKLLPRRQRREDSGAAGGSRPAGLGGRGAGGVSGVLREAYAGENAALRRHSGAAARLGGARLEAGGALQ